MQKGYTIFFTLVWLLAATSAAAQNTKAERRSLRDGDKAYGKENYTAAEIAYRRVLDIDSTSAVARYNMGNALFRQNKFDEATAQ